MKESYKAIIERAEIICEALPYIRRYRDKTIVIKYGGNAMNDPAITKTVLQDVAALKIVGVNPILVHGGGPEINKMLTRLEIKPHFENGLRVTDEATMEIVQMILCGKINKNITAELNTMGVKAVGLCGKDFNLIEARARENELGFVGKVTHVNAEMLQELTGKEFVPVIASVGVDERGRGYNVNADEAAAEISSAMDAVQLMYLTDTDGILKDENDRKSLIDAITVADLRAMIANKQLTGGMLPKANSCIDAIERGVPSVMVLNGMLPHAILLELFTDNGVGTLVKA